MNPDVAPPRHAQEAGKGLEEDDDPVDQEMLGLVRDVWGIDWPHPRHDPQRESGLDPASG